MCETIAKAQRRAYRDQDPPRIHEARGPGPEDPSAGDSADRGGDSPVGRQQQQQQRQQQQHHQRREESPVSGTVKVSRTFEPDSAGSTGRCDTSAGATAAAAATTAAGGTRAEHLDEDSTAAEAAAAAAAAAAKVPLPSSSAASAAGKHANDQVITNGIKREADGKELLTNGREMAPEMGVPPPPPAPHMSPDGLILPRKPYNPCLISNNHKDLRRELQFNKKIGKNVLNQKSELQRALEKQREAAMRKEAERNREETYKDDPRTALQRAIEQRARQIQLTEQPQNVEPPNPLVTARAKLRPRTDSQ